MTFIKRLLAFSTVLATASACATSPRASEDAPEVKVTTAATTTTEAQVTPESQPTVVILVRHAEKADNSSDPELSAAGMERARALVESVRRAKVSSIITTQFKRTRATAEPAATALGITPQVIAASGPQHPAEVADAIRARPGIVTLVVGHSNTVPAIIAALGAQAPVICDSEYDNLYVLTLPTGGSPVLVATHYGAESQRGVGCPAMK